MANLIPRPASSRVSTPPAPASDPETAETEYREALELACEKRFEEALRRLAPHCAAGGPSAPHLTLRAHILFERGDAAEAVSAVARALELDPWSVDALLLQGRIARFRGEMERATGYFRQAVYHNPDCWPAHYHLAELYREGGETELARREYRIVLRQLRDDTATRVTGPWLLAVAIKDLRFLCETRLSRLDAAAG